MRKRHLTTAIAVLTVVGLLGACGGGDDDDSSTGTSANPEDAMESAALDFAACMRDNGIEDYPDPDLSGGGLTLVGPEQLGVSEEQYRQADDACRDILEDAEDELKANLPDLSPEEVAELQDKGLALARCMREKGHENFPDPNVDEDGGITVQAPPGGRPDDVGFEEFQQDLRECHDESGLATPQAEPQTQESGGSADGSTP